MPTFYTEADLPLAETDMTLTQVIEHDVEISRKVFAGTRVPPDLVDAYKAAVKQGDKPTKPADNAEPELDDLKRPELDAMACELGVDEPDKLPNKAAVIEAIEAKQAQAPAE